MSDILTIYDAIEAMNVSYNNGSTVFTPSVLNLDDLKDSLAAVKLPIRCLYPLSNLSQDNQMAITNLRGGVATVEWSILDLLLWKPVAQGSGLHSVARDLIGFSGAYVDTLKNNVRTCGGGE